MNPDAAFAELEKLNAEVDIWIDDEEFDEVEKYLAFSTDAVSRHGLEYPGDGSCTRVPVDTAHKWSKFWSNLETAVAAPVPHLWPASGRLCSALSRLEGTQLARHWSILFCAKLVRARIQRAGSDCHLSRLDDVVAFLERHFPHLGSAGGTDLRLTMLTVIYLLELSAAAEAQEQLGFAQRAERIMKTYPGMDPSFRKRYQLWVNYALGMAHLHSQDFRRALSEFDLVLFAFGREERQKTQQAMGPLADHAENLLHVPSLLQRAETLLKMQLPYHALCVLEGAPTPSMSICKKARRALIKAECYLQMDRGEEARVSLNEACALVIEGPGGQRANTHDPAEWLPGLEVAATMRNVARKAVELLIDYHLALLRQSTFVESMQPEVPNLLERLNGTRLVFGAGYRMTKHTPRAREGFHQQLAKALDCLVRLGGKTRTEPRSDAAVKTATEPRLDAAMKTAVKLYHDYGNGVLPKGRQDGTQDCPVCSPEDGLGLERWDAGSYREFTKNMREFYKETRERLGMAREADEQILIEHLSKLQTENRDDLRIAYLGLCYQSEEANKRARGDCSECGGSGAMRALECLPDGPLQCVGPVSSGRGSDCRSGQHYEQVIKGWHRRFSRQLLARTIHEPGRQALHLVGLQRWNSSSPAEGQSLGGGYFLYLTDPKGCVDLGVAIDPGFDFLRNLFHMGFTLRDIDVVLISHAHIDHCRDLESMITLLGELYLKKKQRKRLHVVLTRAVYRRVHHLMDSPFSRQFIEPYVIDLDRDIRRDYFERLDYEPIRFTFSHAKCCKDKAGQISTSAVTCRASDMADDSSSPPSEPRCLEACSQCRRPSCYDPVVSKNFHLDAETRRHRPPRLDVLPTRAYHDDHMDESDTFGFRIHVDCSGHTVRLGYTADTKYVYRGVRLGERTLGQVGVQYSDCQAILVHLGSLIDPNDGFSRYVPDDARSQGQDVGRSEKCETLIKDRNHPYLPGLLKLLREFVGHSKVERDQGWPLILISEFGEELRGGIRADLIARLRRKYPGASFLPVDVGLDVLLWDGDGGGRGRGGASNLPGRSVPGVRCVVCWEYVEPKDAEFEHYGVDEGLYCVCRFCKDGTPLNVRQDRLRQLYEVGCEPVLAL